MVAACLDFVAELEPGEAQVVVVANGCTDATADAARAVPGVTVLELAEGSKTAALNAGDAAVSAFPRIYLDADVGLSAATLRRLADELDTDQPLVAAPTVRFELTQRPFTVRWFYAAYQQLPYVREGLTGLGVYGLSAAGRARFGQFPTLFADDLFVQRLFAPHERRTLADTEFSVQTPRTLAALLAVRTRTVFGNTQLAAHAPGDASFGATSGGTSRALLDGVRARRIPAPSAVVYTLVMLEARRRARGRDAGTWHRDDSTR